jgi:hypothetical protein
MRPISVRPAFRTLASGCVMAILMPSCSSGHSGGDPGRAALGSVPHWRKIIKGIVANINAYAVPFESNTGLP